MNTTTSTQTESSILQRVKDSLDGIRPYLVADGGDIEVIEVTPEHTVRLKLLGNCKDCTTSFMTMKAGVEEAIMRAVPEIVRVEAI